jgi:hypothetical protein
MVRGRIALPYEIVLARSARREIERIPIQSARRILTLIERLALEPRPPGTHKLHGSDDRFASEAQIAGPSTALLKARIG